MSSKVIKKNKANKLIYTTINITENTKEKECIAADKKNEKKYRETIEKLGVTSKEWENTGVMLNLEIPTPPNPSNYENLLEYRRTHVLRPAIVQSDATIYLHERGYKLGIDYQAYQAIEIVSKLQDYERENSLPEISNKSLSAGNIDLDVLNISKNTGKRRNTMDIFSHQNLKSPKKDRMSKSFNYDGYDKKKKEMKVAEITNKINQNNAVGKPKSRFNTLRRKSIPNHPTVSNQIFNNSNSKPLEIKGRRFQNTPFSYEPSPQIPPNNFNNDVMPSAPPMPPEYQKQFLSPQYNNDYHKNQNESTNSNSSVDSLFDSEEMKQFEMKYNPQKANNNEVQYRNNQQKYNGIYPSLNKNHETESNGDDFCSV